MSVWERVDIIKRTRDEERRQQEEDEALQRRMWEDRWLNSVPEIRQTHAYQLEELRKLQVVSIVEQVTGEPLFPLTDHRDGHYIVRVPTKEELAQSVQATRGRISSYDFNRRWKAEIPLPTYSQVDGTIDDILVIKLVNKDTVRDHPRPDQLICVTYSPSKIISIIGQEVIFSGKIPRRRVDRVEVLEEAVARAIDKPGWVGKRHSSGSMVPIILGTSSLVND